MNGKQNPDGRLPQSAPRSEEELSSDMSEAARLTDERSSSTSRDSQSTENLDPSQKLNAIIRGYHEFQSRCGSILDNSLNGEHGRMVANSHFFVHELERWVNAIAPNKEQYLLAVAAREYQYALFANAQGLYRQAFKGIRLVLELCLQAVQLSTNQVELQEWLESRKDTVWNALMDESNGVLSLRFARAFFPDLEDDVRHYRGIAQQLYRECSECVHGSMQKYIPLPESLEFSPDSFRLWHDKANGVALVITFALSLRYLRDLSKAKIELLGQDLLDRVGHCAAIRRFLGGPEGG